MTRHGEAGHGLPHESPMVMVVPLVILAVLSFVGGWVGVPKAMGGYAIISNISSIRSSSPCLRAHDVAPKRAAEHEEVQHRVDVQCDFRGSGGYRLHSEPGSCTYKRTDLPDKLAASAGGLYRLVRDKYRIDELYGAVIIQPIIALSTNVFWKGIDRGLIDGAVDGVAAGANETSDLMRRMQSGNIRSYAGWVAVGAAAVIAFMVWRGVR